MSEKLRTGIPLLDRNLGGLQPGRGVLAFGDTGSGKTILGLQFLLAGIEEGQPGILLTLERPEDLLAHAEGAGFQLDAPLEDGRFVLLEYDQDVTHRILRYGWKPFLEKLRPLVVEGRARRLVLDPVHPLFAGSTEEGRLRYDLRYLTDTLEEWGVTTLFLNDRGATQGHPSFYRVFSELCSGVLELQSDMENLDSCHYLFVHKLRPTSGPRRKLAFLIRPGLGIVEPEADPQPLPAAQPSPRGKTVLVADDDPFLRRLLDQVLGQDFRVLFAEDGVEALTLTLRERPDVLLLDVEMPRLSGLEVLKSLRESGFDLPILLVTGRAADPHERVLGLTLGANDCVAKPFHVRELHEKVRLASRSHVERDPAPADLSTLLARASSRTLERVVFMERVAQACSRAAEYSTPCSLVRLSWPPAKPGQETDRDAMRMILRQVLEMMTRPEDALSFTDETEACVLLAVDNETGATAYLRRLRETLESRKDRSGVSAQIKASHVTYHASTGAPWTADEALARVRKGGVRLFRSTSFVAGDGTGVPAERTGTDG